jgi:hypothetical protein
MGVSFEPRWFRGLSVYQDVVLDGQKVLSGARDCPQRWEAIQPQFPPQGRSSTWARTSAGSG